MGRGGDGWRVGARGEMKRDGGGRRGARREVAMAMSERSEVADGVRGRGGGGCAGEGGKERGGEQSDDVERKNTPESPERRNGRSQEGEMAEGESGFAWE